MGRPFQLMMARRTAEAFLRKEGITTLPVDPFATVGIQGHYTPELVAAVQTTRAIIAEHA